MILLNELNHHLERLKVFVLDHCVYNVDGAVDGKVLEGIRNVFHVIEHVLETLCVSVASSLHRFSVVAENAAT